MKIVVATKETQGQRDNDFSFCWEGEPLQFPTMTCSSGSADDDCGCSRSMVGMFTQRATTTMKVLEVDKTPVEMASFSCESLAQGGWIVNFERRKQEVEDFMTLGEMLSGFEVGDIVEFRDGQFSRRVK